MEKSIVFGKLYNKNKEVADEALAKISISKRNEARMNVVACLLTG